MRKAYCKLEIDIYIYIYIYIYWCKFTIYIIVYNIYNYAICG